MITNFFIFVLCYVFCENWLYSHRFCVVQNRFYCASLCMMSCYWNEIGFHIISSHSNEGSQERKRFSSISLDNKILENMLYTVVHHECTPVHNRIWMTHKLWLFPWHPAQSCTRYARPCIDNFSQAYRLWHPSRLLIWNFDKFHLRWDAQPCVMHVRPYKGWKCSFNLVDQNRVQATIFETLGPK